MLIPAHAGYTPDLTSPPYDLKKAQALIKEAGPAAKVEVELLTSPVFDQRIVQALQQMLVEAGLNVKINMSDMANYLKRAQSTPDVVPALSFGRWSWCLMSSIVRWWKPNTFSRSSRSLSSGPWMSSQNPSSWQTLSRAAIALSCGSSSEAPLVVISVRT